MLQIPENNKRLKLGLQK